MRYDWTGTSNLTDEEEDMTDLPSKFPIGSGRFNFKDPRQHLRRFNFKEDSHRDLNGYLIFFGTLYTRENE